MMTKLDQEADLADLAAWRLERMKRLDAGLGLALRRLEQTRPLPAGLAAALRYALLGGGKRLRPLLALAAAEAVAGTERAAWPLALAVEMVHAYSLVHDDLPGMDNDDLRRGRPTCHKVFGEGLAILAGDALLTLAFSTLTEAAVKAASPLAGRRLLQATAKLAWAAGAAGMVGGQVMDMNLEGRAQAATTGEVRRMERLKTGELMAAALAGGGRLAGGSADDLRRLRVMGLNLGLAFQIQDDLLNQSGDPELTGKAVGSDAARGKSTLPALMGPAAAEIERQALRRKIMSLAKTFQPRGYRLLSLLTDLTSRNKFTAIHN